MPLKGLFGVQGIEDRSENQVGRQSGNLTDRGLFPGFPEAQPLL